jgi:hypothetical protein
VDKKRVKKGKGKVALKNLKPKPIRDEAVKGGFQPIDGGGLPLKFR